jgi:alanyl-tRNA synthetase
MMTGNDIRSTFLNYFAGQGHAVVKSSSLVPSNDPSLMFTNSGMVQFKNVFMGDEKRAYTRATSSQRCVRAGGKHNDLENVGHTARHHTFFEMLGNFSFGDYFKEEAIAFAWQLLTQQLKLDPARLCVTVYHDDDEAFNIWNKKIGVAAGDIIRIGDNKGKKYGSDNFWTMGDEGPCGPCTEIFYDHDPSGKMYGGRPGTPEEDGDRWVEIWNLVFMQYYMQGGDVVRKLARTGVDTGSGLERVMATCQGVHSNYDTDIFQAIIRKAADTVGTRYGSGAESDVSLRVLADHLRAMSFLLIDGVMPSNEGRGYVLRRIMRRAMRHGNLLGMDKPFIHGLVPTLAQAMGEAYPELPRGAQMVMDVIKLEEERFGRTLKQGLTLLDAETKTLTAGDRLSGEVAFKLYDTYGFPLDLTADALKAKGMAVDETGFATAMAEQRERARKAGMGGTGQSKLAPVWYDLKSRLPETEFLGYPTENSTGLVSEGRLLALVDGDRDIKLAAKGSKVLAVFNQTPFYAESGGQVGDTGTVTGTAGKARVLDTQKYVDGALFVHTLEVTEGTLTVGDDVRLAVDADRRQRIRRNHSVTHLLHAALRTHLGDHVFQKGSLVSDEKMRFDFSHPKALTDDEKRALEEAVNTMIWANAPVTTRLMTQDAAIASGAMALFGEKYGDEVRVLTMGEGALLSVELCGGTHVTRTGDIGLFKIIGESSVAAGVRRVEGVTGMAALGLLNKADSALKTIAADLKVKPDEVAERVTTLQKDLKEAKKEGAAKAATVDAAALVASAEKVGGVAYIGAEVACAPADMRTLVDDLKNRLGSGVIVLVAKDDDKAALVAGVTKDLTARFNASAIVNAAAEQVGGKGGGRPDMATAGGKDPSKLADALKAARVAVGG